MFLHNYHPNSIAFEIFGIQIHWYGVLIGLGVICGLLVILQLAKKYKVKGETILDLTFYSILFGIIGARLFYVLYNLDYFIRHPLESFMIWKGGVASHGMILFGITAIWIYCRKKKINLGMILDLGFTGLILGQAIGRWGNYFNQEIFGKPTLSFWGIPIDPINRPFGYEEYMYFHPTFLYQSVANLIIFLLLISFWQIRARNEENKRKYGLIALACLLLYSIARFGVESLRIDPVPEFYGLRIMQWFSLLIIALVVAIYFKYFFKRKKA